MKSEMSDIDFKPWYDKFTLSGKKCNLTGECENDCKAEVEVLSKAALAVRKIFKDGLDIYPLRYNTLGPLCINIFGSKYMPDERLVNNKTVSKVCREWRVHCYNHIKGREYG